MSRHFSTCVRPFAGGFAFFSDCGGSPRQNSRTSKIFETIRTLRMALFGFEAEVEYRVFASRFENFEYSHMAKIMLFKKMLPAYDDLDRTVV